MPDQVPPPTTRRLFAAVLAGDPAAGRGGHGGRPDPVTTAELAADLHQLTERIETLRQVVEVLRHTWSRGGTCSPQRAAGRSPAELTLAIATVEAQAHTAFRSTPSTG